MKEQEVKEILRRYYHTEYNDSAAQEICQLAEEGAIEVLDRLSEIEQARQEGRQEIIEWVDNTNVGDDLYIKFNRDHWIKAKSRWQALKQGVKE